MSNKEPAHDALRRPIKRLIDLLVSIVDVLVVSDTVKHSKGQFIAAGRVILNSRMLFNCNPAFAREWAAAGSACLLRNPLLRLLKRPRCLLVAGTRGTPPVLPKLLVPSSASDALEVLLELPICLRRPSFSEMRRVFFSASFRHSAFT